MLRLRSLQDLPLDRLAAPEAALAGAVEHAPRRLRAGVGLRHLRPSAIPGFCPWTAAAVEYNDTAAATDCCRCGAAAAAACWTTHAAAAEDGEQATPGAGGERRAVRAERQAGDPLPKGARLAAPERAECERFMAKQRMCYIKC